MHQAFYRKWRPMTFADVCGQEHITSILQFEVSQQKTSHAYLFCGSRGTGKTTCAKILAKAINCENPQNGNPCGKCNACQSIQSESCTDVLEMDAASNNGVENIRDIRDEVAYMPSTVKNRVYIVDEVHMLSISAFNALLKTLEEPPPHVVFILATTESQKIPATILSRCQRFDFRRIATPVIAERLQWIAQQEALSLQKEAAFLLAKLAQGGMRDAISLFELCAGEPQEITVDTVNRIVGVTGREVITAVVQAIVQADYETIFEKVQEIITESNDILMFWQDLIGFYRDMMVVKSVKTAKEYLEITQQEAHELSAIANQYKFETLLYHSRLLDAAFSTMQRNHAMKRLTAEMTLLRMCDEKLDTSNEALLLRIAKLEDRIALSGIEAVSVPPASPHLKPLKEEKGLKGVSYWQEVISKVAQIVPTVVGFLKEAQCRLDPENHKIYIMVSDQFAVSMIKKPQTMNEITKAFNLWEKEKNYTEDDVIIQCIPKKESEIAGLEKIDEIQI